MWNNADGRWPSLAWVWDELDMLRECRVANKQEAKT